MVPNFFAFVYIADVYFDNRRGDSRYGIGNGQRCVCVCTGVENYSVGDKSVLMDVVYYLSFVIGLHITYVDVSVGQS